MGADRLMLKGSRPLTEGHRALVVLLAEVAVEQFLKEREVDHAEIMEAVTDAR